MNAVVKVAGMLPSSTFCKRTHKCKPQHKNTYRRAHRYAYIRSPLLCLPRQNELKAVFGFEERQYLKWIQFSRKKDNEAPSFNGSQGNRPPPASIKVDLDRLASNQTDRKEEVLPSMHPKPNGFTAQYSIIATSKTSRLPQCVIDGSGLATVAKRAISLPSPGAALCDKVMVPILHSLRRQNERGQEGTASREFCYKMAF
ncbi:unnamed protein product [Protopolystoma xenopodis]|uniref:Uncharacterized protein n=1 Tax=Protopolystoma xenopodis TaxID=117903 RepID=A0A3S5CV88_9PLAT|nr:unnamed protein product [Protopolystoma xenopodis]